MSKTFYTLVGALFVCVAILTYPSLTKAQEDVRVNEQGCIQLANTFGELLYERQVQKKAISDQKVELDSVKDQLDPRLYSLYSDMINQAAVYPKEPAEGSMAFYIKCMAVGGSLNQMKGTSL